MVRIKDTTETVAKRRFGNYRDKFLLFPAGETVTEVEDEALAAWAIETFDQLERASTTPDDYKLLQQLAVAAATEVVDGNSTKAEIVEWFESLDGERQGELLREVEADG